MFPRWNNAPNKNFRHFHKWSTSGNNRVVRPFSSAPWIRSVMWAYALTATAYASTCWSEKHYIFGRDFAAMNFFLFFIMESYWVHLLFISPAYMPPVDNQTWQSHDVASNPNMTFYFSIPYLFLGCCCCCYYCFFFFFFNCCIESQVWFCARRQHFPFQQITLTGTVALWEMWLYWKWPHSCSIERDNKKRSQGPASVQRSSWHFKIAAKFNINPGDENLS